MCYIHDLIHPFVHVTWQSLQLPCASRSRHAPTFYVRCHCLGRLSPIPIIGCLITLVGLVCYVLPPYREHIPAILVSGPETGIVQLLVLIEFVQLFHTLWIRLRRFALLVFTSDEMMLASLVATEVPVTMITTTITTRRFQLIFLSIPLVSSEHALKAIMDAHNAPTPLATVAQCQFKSFLILVLV